MRYLSYILLLLVSWACQKAPERTCWKTAGPTQNLKVPLSSFTYLHIHPHIEVALVQDSMDYIEWQAGAHLLPFLSAEIQADTLQLQNNNGCKFLRYRNGQVNAVVHFSSINELHVSNSDAIQTQQQWFANDLLIFLKEGVGTVDLNITAQKVTVRNNYGWQTLKLTGTVGSLFVDLDGSSSLQAASLLVADSISFRSISPLSSWVRSGPIKLKAQLYGAGDLFYTIKPAILLKTEYSTGKVRPKQ